MLTRNQYQQQRNQNRMNRYYGLIPSNTHHHTLLVTVIIIVLLALGVFYGVDANHSMHHFNQTAYQQPNQSTSAESRMQNHQPINVLMMGTDTGALGRHEKRGRTDTMMIDTINPQQQNMELTSIPRDSPAQYNGLTTKINSVYTLGGGDATEKYVQDWLGVPINYYMVINMGGLDNIINSIGGVTVTPPLTFKYGATNVHKGQTVTLNGYQALDYCRMRHQDPRGDYGRQIRQRQVLFQVFDKVSEMHTMFLHPNLANQLSNNIQTNIPSKDLMRMFLFYRHASRHHISNHLQGQTTVMDGQDFEAIPANEKQQKVHEIMKDY